MQIETGDEAVAELAERKIPDAPVAEPVPVPVAPVSAPTPAAAEEPVFNPDELSTVLEEAGLELVQTRSEQTQPVVTEAPVKLGRPRKSVAKLDTDVKLVQVNTSKSE